MGAFSPDPPKAGTAYSVSSLVEEMKAILEGTYRQVWVEGEISGFMAAQSGHCYFTLKDAGAQLSVVLFRRDAMRLARLPQNGQHVLLSGKASVYAQRGQLQLIAERVFPQGVGKLYEQIEQLKARFLAEGLFDPARKRPLPFLPARIALVTSARGAALYDMLRVLKRRAPEIDVLIVPTLVQGAEAPEAIARAIGRAQLQPGVELLIVGRGGGSLEDLMAFNSEAVVRAIAACPVPVISAVGHEVDVTLADHAADLRAATPSVAAELAVPKTAELAARLGELDGTLRRRIAGRLRQARLALANAAARLVSPAERLRLFAQRLKTAELGLRRAHEARLSQAQVRLGRLQQRLAAQDPGARRALYAARLAHLEERLHRVAEAALEAARRRAVTNNLRLQALSPLAVLSRGYALVQTPEGRVITEAQRLLVGAEVELCFARDRATARITRVDVD